MTEARGLAVLVPLKPFALAKSRLGSRFDDATRARIAERLASQVLRVATQTFPGAVYVVADRALREFVEAAGATWVDQRISARSLGVVIDGALDGLGGVGHSRALVLMGDLPDVSSESLTELMRASTDVVLAESGDGRGTNALVMPLPRTFSMAFAEDGSGLTHEARARSAGLSFTRTRDPALLRDLDRPSDLLADEADALGGRGDANRR